MKNTLICFFVLLISQFAYTQREVIDQVVAIVGSEIVQLSDVEERFALSSSQQGGLPPDARCTIMNQILGQKLLVNQAKLDSVLITDVEVEVQLDARIERILSYMNGDVRQFEEYYGQTVNQVKQEFREDLRNEILSERMRGQIIAGITVTPAEVKEFFNSIPKDSLPYFNSEVEVGEIAYQPRVNDEERQIALDKILDLRKQIVEDSTDFAVLARKFSADPGSRIAGGDLGWTTRGKFVPEFEAAAYSLDIDEISEPVETDFGFHLIQLLGKRGNSIKTRHILIKPEITDADLELAKSQLDTVRNLVQTDSLTFSIAVKRYSEEDVQSYTNDGRMVNPLTGNTFFEIGDLDPDIYFTIDTMQVNNISAPFEYTTPMGETAYRIVQLQSRTDPHVASLELDYSKIRQAAIDAKKSEYIKNWLEDTVDATYVYIHDMYKTCPILENWLKDN